jgi:hypothetical protein
MSGFPQAQTLPALTDSDSRENSATIWQELASYLPWTTGWNRRCRLQIRKDTKQRLNLYRKLRSVPEPLKTELLPGIRHRETRLAEIEVAADNMIGIVGVLFVAAALAAVVAFYWQAWSAILLQDFRAPATVWHAFRPPRFLPPAQRWLLVGAIGAFIPILVAILANGMRIRGTAPLFAPMALVPALAFSALLYYDSRWHSWHVGTAFAHHPYLASFAIGTTLWLAMAVVFMPFALLREAYASQRRREAAGAQLTHSLIAAIEYIERNGRRWQESGYKSTVVYYLENVATCLERDLVWDAALRQKDIVLWFRDTLAAKAEAVRQLSRWVLTPKSDTREHLVQQLVTLMAASVRDDLDSFPVVSESHAEKRRTLWLRITSVISSLVSAGVPGAVVWFAHKLGLADAWFSYGAIASVLWACVVLMGIVDPAYAEHLESFKKLSDTLPFGKGKGGSS